MPAHKLRNEMDLNAGACVQARHGAFQDAQKEPSTSFRHPRRPHRDDNFVQGPMQTATHLAYNAMINADEGPLFPQTAVMDPWTDPTEPIEYSSPIDPRTPRPYPRRLGAGEIR